MADARAKAVPVLAALLASFAAMQSAHAQSSTAFVKVWSAGDPAYSGVWMDKDAHDNVYRLGYTAVGDVIITQKLDADGNLLWSQVVDPAYRVRGQWLEVDAALPRGSGRGFGGSTTTAGSRETSLRAWACPRTAAASP